MADEALLKSWNDTPARHAITEYVRSVSTDGAADYAAPAERVAVFDNDGTLWSEKPIPIQLDFTLFRLAKLAAKNSSLRERQPYKAAAERDYRWLGEAMVKHYHGEDDDLRLLVLHDDAGREFAYTAGAEDARDRAKAHGWTIVSVKDDWGTVFADP